MEELDRIFSQQDQGQIISQLKSKRSAEPDVTTSKKHLDPMQHDVFDPTKRPNKRVKVDPDDRDDASTVVTDSNGEKQGYRSEPVARIALALQQLIVKRAVSFIFGNPVELNAQAENDQQKEVVKAVSRVLYDIKEKSFNRKVARNLFSCTEVAEIWYPVKKKTTAYGFDSEFKLRCGIFSPLNGDRLYPYFDETGDMIAFSREFSIIGTDKVTKNYFETYTADKHYMWVVADGSFKLVEGFPKPNAVGKIPVIYGHQPAVEWADVQVLIDRLEKLLSNFADTNDYHASPKIFVKGELVGFAKKGEAGAILQGDENSSAEYLSWANAPESVKLEIETLLRMIYTLTQTPDISFDSVKGIGAVSGIALKLLFMDAHLKVAEHQEVFDEYLQRRINVIKAFVANFNVKLKGEAEDMQIEPVITPYMIVDEAAELKIWQDANGGNPVISQKASFGKAGLTQDTEADFEQYQNEQNARNSFVIGEPTES